MSRPFDRIRLGAFVMATVFVVAVIGYKLFGYDWVTAIWMVVITISSVGYSESTSSSPAFQLFTVLVILVGMTAAAYTFGGFIQLTTKGEIQNMLGKQRMKRDIGRLKNHVLICGFGRTGRLVAEALEIRNQPFVVIDNDPALIQEAEERNYLALVGDATEDELLLECGVKQAKSLISVLPTDAENVFITLTARTLCPDILIVARAEQQSTEKKLRQAGANRIVLPSVIGAGQMARMITRPSTADLMELFAETSYLDLDLDEIHVQEAGRLDGSSIKESDAHRSHHLLFVAVKPAGEEMIFNPGGDYRFSVGDIVVVMGRMENIRQFRQMCSGKK
ncbi:MAG: NAD-binding protein [bacterium]|nr:NAD-binding protein [bacterium]